MKTGIHVPISEEGNKMEAYQIYAHRGVWQNYSQQNTLQSLLEALSQGFSIETDFRDLNNEIIISHDPPKSGHEYLDLVTLIKNVSSFEDHQKIAANIKSDGLCPIFDANISLCKERFIFFDGSVPDMLQYKSSKLQFLNRNSEFEHHSNQFSENYGVWVDAFSDEKQQMNALSQVIENDEPCFVVSPELHGRNHIPLWNKLKKNGFHRSALLNLCTDYPQQALEFFNEN